MDVKINKGYVILLSVIVALGGFLLGFDSAVISGAVPYYKEFFNLTEDPEEFVNLYNKEKDTAAALENTLITWKEKGKGSESKSTPQKVEIDEVTRSKLESLGYLHY